MSALQGTFAGPLSLLHWLGAFYFESSFTLDLDIYNNFAVQAHGIVSAGQQRQVVSDNLTQSCNFTFSSPVHDIPHAMEEVLFRTAHAPGVLCVEGFLLTIESQTFQATQVTPTLVFHSNHRCLGIAIGILTLALLALLIPLRGWWQLRRQVGLSPLETAKAFGAPLMTTLLWQTTPAICWMRLATAVFGTEKSQS
jgi:hypothetical protein